MRAARFALRWLPLPIILSIGGGALSAVAGLEPEALHPARDVSTLNTPIVSVRRVPTEVYTIAIENRARADLFRDLDEYLTGLPTDTCLVVADGDGSRYEHRPDDAQVPASVEKIVTGAAALLGLGADHRFVTRAAAVQPPSGGVVAGDLFLIGGGDPVLATAAYAARYGDDPQPFTDIGALADAVVAAGITRIDGTVLGDESRYDTVRYHPAWPPRFQTQNQTGPLSALNVNDGFASFPAMGSFPVVPAADPAANAAAVFRDELVIRGVEVVGGAGSGLAPPEAVDIAALESAPLIEIVGQSLRFSDNGTAELLLKELGFEATVSPGTFEAGADRAEAILDAAGFPADEIDVVDGSGLADTDRLTCSALVDILDHDPIEPALLAGMAVSGESGTLRNRWLDTDLVGRIRAKTGTLNQVTALAGYATASDGTVRRFAMVVNVEAPQFITREAVVSQEVLARLLTRPAPDIDLTVFSVR